MRIRLKFLPNNQKNFLSKVQEKSGFSTKELAKIAEVHTRSFTDWKNEKLNMTLFAAEKFSNKFNIALPEEKRITISRWRQSQKLAAKKGGEIRFKLYGNFATAEGRRKGGIKSIATLRANGKAPRIKIFNIADGFSEELAEFVGIMLGDGSITPGQCNITLNYSKDYKYSGYVSDLGEKLFGEKPKILIIKNENTMRLYYNGIFLVRHMLSIGLPIGNKVKQQVGVPEWIKSKETYKMACLRGLMDTDGGVFLHRYKVNGKVYEYKKISFANRSIPLLLFVKHTLEELAFNPKIIDKVENKKVWLYNMQEVSRYMKLVGTSNNRLSISYGG